MRVRLFLSASVWTLVAGMSLYPSLADAAEPAVGAPIGAATGLGPVEYVGDFPAYFRSEIEQAIINALARTGEVPITLDADQCVQVGCVRQAATQTSAEVIVMSRLIHEHRDYQFEFTAYAVDDGRVLGETAASCSICGQQELLDAIPAKLIELDAKVARAFAARTWPARLAVDGAPARAHLVLDGDDLGASPLARDIEPGEHQLEIAAQGYATQLHRWTAVDGVEQRIEYTLLPTSSLRGLQIGGWVAVSVGIVGTGAGVTLAALHGRNHLPTCSPELLDINGGCPNIYSTAVPGYLSLGLGVAAIAAGVGLLVHHRQRSGKDRGARVGVTADGFSLQF